MKNNESVVLSISILMSGRKETRQCLDSLVPIMDSIPCELILVDTGCDEEKRKILEEYTDIIIPFEWCDDFSKARNAGLKKATGEWFMFLDDDEWFVDASEIIEFFKSGEYKLYNSATYRVRNYTTYSEQSYTDSYAGRMTKLTHKTEFKGSIHEYISPMLPPNKLFDTYVKHFGYVYHSQKDLYKDSNRNLNLLKKEIEKEPNDLRIALLMLQEYRRLNELDNVIEFALKYIDIVNNNDLKEQNVENKLCSFYTFVLEAYERKFDYKEEINYLDKIKDDKRLNELTKAFLYKSEVIASYGLKEYKRAYNAFTNYMKLYKKLSKDDRLLYMQSGMLTDNIFVNNTYRNVIFIGIMYALKLDKADVFNQYFDELEWKEDEIYTHPDFVSNIMKYILDNSYDDKYIYYVNEMIKRKSCLRQLIAYVRGIENNCMDTDNLSEDVIKENKARFDNAVKLLSHIDNQNWYFTYMKVLNYNNTKDKLQCEKDLDNLFKCVVDVFNIDNKLWNIIEEVNIDFNKLINNISFEKWQMGLNSWITNADEEDIVYKKKIISKWENEGNYKYIFFNMKVAEYYVRQAKRNKNVDDELDDSSNEIIDNNYIDNINDKNDKEEELTFEQIEERLYTYANVGYNYYSKVYSEDILKNHQEILTQDCKLILELKNIESLRNNNENKKVLEQLKNLIDIYEPFNDIIQVYGQQLGDYIKKNCEINSVNDEMIQLSTALKGKAREFIEAGDEVQAKRILQQVIMYVPSDKEAKEILMMIEE